MTPEQLKQLHIHKMEITPSLEKNLGFVEARQTIQTSDSCFTVITHRAQHEDLNKAISILLDRAYIFQSSLKDTDHAQ